MFRKSAQYIRKEKAKLQVHTQEEDGRCQEGTLRAVERQNGHHNDRQQAGGDQMEGKAGENIGGKPGFPPDRHGMQGVAGLVIGLILVKMFEKSKLIQF